MERVPSGGEAVLVDKLLESRSKHLSRREPERDTIWQFKRSIILCCWRRDVPKAAFNHVERMYSLSTTMTFRLELKTEKKKSISWLIFVNSFRYLLVGCLFLVVTSIMQIYIFIMSLHKYNTALCIIRNHLCKLLSQY